MSGRPEEPDRDAPIAACVAVTPEHEALLAEWRERGGNDFGPPPSPPCPYCHSYDYACPVGGCRAPRTNFTPSERAAIHEDVYEAMLVALRDLPDDAEVDIRDFVPHPERIPLDLETKQTMGELRRRVRELRGGSPGPVVPKPGPTLPPHRESRRHV